MTSRVAWQLSSSADHTCAVGDSTVCFGRNDQRQIITAVGVNTELPAVIDGAWRAVAAGGDHTCPVGGAQQLRCIGADEHGQLGLTGRGRTCL